MVDQQAKEQFVESWGSLGMLWGINRSMARIQALLIASEQPLSLDDIAEHLQISRGNTSMSLKGSLSSKFSWNKDASQDDQAAPPVELKLTILSINVQFTPFTLTYEFNPNPYNINETIS